jgi:hypothetical protein
MILLLHHQRQRRYDDNLIVACDCCISSKVAKARHTPYDDDNVIVALGASLLVERGSIVVSGWHG